MDSGNSGSLQSSSTGGGDEEYDSRAAFFNNSNPTSHVGPMPNPPSLPSSSSTYLYHEVHDPSLFTNFFGHPSLAKSPQPSSFNTNTNSFVNLDMLWSRNLRSDPNCTDLGNLMASSSSRHQHPTLQDMQAAPTVQENDQRASVSASNDQNINISSSNAGRSSKKRSRASRRAPTTVLTTDTTNFRAMVQEFTGIPAPPFTSSFPRNRLDLFGTSSVLRSGLGQFDASPSSSSYLLRPFAQRVQPSSSSLFGSFKADAISSTTVTTTTANNNISNATISQLGYPMPCDLEAQNLINTTMQNHVLNFQSFLQGPPRYPSTTIFGSKQPQGSSSLGIQTTDHSQLKNNMGTLEDPFGRSIHGPLHPHNLGGIQNIVSSEGWADDGDRGLLRSINGSYSSTSQGGVDIINNGENKGPEDVVAPRSEGIVESWICSSD